MAEAVKKPRPEFRNIGIGQILTAYRLPLAGRVSILHRLSGGLLFVFLPFLLYLFDQSLTSELSFEVFKGFLSNIIVKLITLVLAWAFLFHFCAGVRHLFMDTSHGLGDQGEGQADFHRRSGGLVASDDCIRAQTLRSILKNGS